MKSFDNKGSVPPSGQTQTSERNSNDGFAVIGNERMTALAGAVLLVLILIELVSAATLHALLSVHAFVGVLLVGPLLVKLGSTGYRFLRYYTGSPAYRRKGPPRLPLRVLALLLVVTTLAVVGSGVGLVVTGPQQAGILLSLHNLSVLFWLSLITVHVCAYFRRTFRLIGDDWAKRTDGKQHAASFLWLSVNFGAGFGGVVVAALLFSGVAPWIAWSQTSQTISAPLIVGLVLATLVCLSSRPWRWR